MRKCIPADLYEVMERIEEVRMDHGMTKTAFCAELGISPTSYNNYVGGQRSKPSSHLIRCVLAHFPVDPVYLLFGEWIPDAQKQRIQSGT